MQDVLSRERGGPPGPFELGYLVPSTGVSQFDAERATVVDFDRDGRRDVIYVAPRLGTMLVKGR